MKFGWDPMGQDRETDIALVREARAGLGPDQRPDDRRRAGLRRQDRHPARHARSSNMTRSGSRSRCLPDDYEGYAKLAAATSLRIAAGEEESERKSFLQLMDVGKIDVVQVDLTRCGGFTEAIKIAALAADRGLPVVNHGFTTYLNVAAALALPGEHPQHAGPARIRRRRRDHACEIRSPRPFAQVGSCGRSGWAGAGHRAERGWDPEVPGGVRWCDRARRSG